MQRFTTNNYTIVKLIEPKTVLASGLHIREQDAGPARFAYVLDIGEGLSDINGEIFPVELEVGDLIFIMQHGPEKADYTDEGLGVLHILHEGDVYLKLKLAADGTVTTFPMGNYVDIEVLQETVQEVTSGGIYLPEVVREKPTKARVVSVGPGQRTMKGYHAPRVSPGDIIRFREHAPIKFTMESLGIPLKDRYLIPYGDIVLIENDTFVSNLKERIDEHVKPI